MTDVPYRDNSIDPCPRRRRSRRRASRFFGILPYATLLVSAVCVVALTGMSGHPPLASDGAKPHSGAAPCSGRYPLAATIGGDAGTAPAARDGAGWLSDLPVPVARRWGVEPNMAIATDGGREVLEIRYPKGSINPSNDDTHPIGGAGFLAKLSESGLERACLRYRLRFDSKFAFAKGGKLPGLYGGDAPSGGDEVSGSDGFSTRLMWRSDGEGEVYAYVANKDSDYGASIGRGNWVFEPGRWSTVEQEVILNDPDASDGVIRVWFDGELVVEQTDVVFRTDRSGTVDGLMFSTFFGGSDKSWASPRDQKAWFGDFALYGEPKPGSKRSDG